MSSLLGAGLVGLLLTATAGRAEGPALSRFVFGEPHMGTRFELTLYALDEKTAGAAAKAAFARIAELDGIMSDYKSTSELMRLCARAGGEPVPVSEDLFTVLAKAQEVSKRSDGAFDVTVGPVMQLWRRSWRTQRLPDPEQLSKARELVGYDKVVLDARARTVQLKKAGMRLDLGGIGKGFAADATLATLAKQGVTRALVAAGGDIACGAPPPEADGWNVAIQPLLDDGKPPRFLRLKDAAVSTSGDREQHVEIDGKRYSHIIDPRTGMGLTGRRSVTVVASRGIDSDSMTKVVSVLGAERGFKLIDQIDGAAAYVVQKLDDKVETLESRDFRKWLRVDEDGTKKPREALKKQENGLPDPPAEFNLSKGPAGVPLVRPLSCFLLPLCFLLTHCHKAIIG
jgi:thiamine biosynthesis lipoprotein